MEATPFDDRPCLLGEGVLWHPERGQLFWFDILNTTLMTRTDAGAAHWVFDEFVSAAGWIDRDRLLIAGVSGLIDFNVETGAKKTVVSYDLGAGLRPNDGRADPWGGLWISSMGLKAEKKAGSIYRYHHGTVAKLFSGITIPNAICFSPDRQWGYFADTDLGHLNRVRLDAATGAPAGDPEILVDFSGEGLNPDGAVTDARGNLWIAQWGASRVAAYSPEGSFIEAVSVGAPQASCPAFGGPDFSTLFCTTAREGMDAAALAAHPRSGMVFSAQGAGEGKAEPQVIL